MNKAAALVGYDHIVGIAEASDAYERLGDLGDLEPKGACARVLVDKRDCGAAEVADRGLVGGGVRLPFL